MSDSHSCSGVHGGSGCSFQRPIASFTSANSRWNSGVFVAYQSAVVGRTADHASVVHRLTAQWSGWPVMPSGPNVTMRSGAMSAMWSATVSGAVVLVARAVLEAEDAQLVARRRGEALAQLVVTKPPEARGRTALGVTRAVVAERGGDHDDSVSVAPPSAIRPADR